jgi:hypothetical protein
MIGHVVKIELEAVLQRGQPATMCGRPASLGGEPTSLPWILSCRHMERYSCGGLDSAGCKVVPAGRPAGPTWQWLWPTGSTWSEVDHGVFGLTFC